METAGWIPTNLPQIGCVCFEFERKDFGLIKKDKGGEDLLTNVGGVGINEKQAELQRDETPFVRW